MNIRHTNQFPFLDDIWMYLSPGRTHKHELYNLLHLTVAYCELDQTYFIMDRIWGNPRARIDYTHMLEGMYEY